MPSFPIIFDVDYMFEPLGVGPAALATRPYHAFARGRSRRRLQPAKGQRRRRHHAQVLEGQRDLAVLDVRDALLDLVEEPFSIVPIVARRVKSACSSSGDLGALALSLR